MEKLILILRITGVICFIFSIYTYIKGDFLTSILSMIYCLILLILTII